MPIYATTIVTVANPRLLDPHHNFQSYTEKRDLPRVVECFDDGLSSTNANFPCQQGCGTEPPFHFIVEPTDRIPLQFQVEDDHNPDPEAPAEGWRGAAGSYWIELQVMSMADTILWQGDTALIASFWQVGFTQYGGYQNIVVDMAKLLVAVPTLPECFYFRLAINSYVRTYEVVNADRPPAGSVLVGYTYIHFGTETIRTWNGTAFTSAAPVVGLYYAAEQAVWYEWDGDSFVGLAEPPAPVDTDIAYRYTMGYRMRHCNESVLHFRSTSTGRDCLGYIHDLDEDGVGCTPAQCKLQPFDYDFKVKGGLDVEELPMTRERTRNGRLISATSATRARMRTAGLPEAVARMIQAVFTSPDAMVNEQEWDEVDALRKNNDTGLHWWIDAVLVREDCEGVVPC